MRADINVGHRPRTGAGSINREPSGETERVQDIFPATQPANHAAILTLIQKKSGFLALQNICFKAQTTFKKNNRAGRWLAD